MTKNEYKAFMLTGCVREIESVLTELASAGFAPSAPVCLNLIMVSKTIENVATSVRGRPLGSSAPGGPLGAVDANGPTPMGVPLKG